MAATRGKCLPTPVVVRIEQSVGVCLSVCPVNDFRMTFDLVYRSLIQPETAQIAFVLHSSRVVTGGTRWKVLRERVQIPAKAFLPSTLGNTCHTYYFAVR